MTAIREIHVGDSPTFSATVWDIRDDDENPEPLPLALGNLSIRGFLRSPTGVLTELPQDNLNLVNNGVQGRIDITIPLQTLTMDRQWKIQLQIQGFGVQFSTNVISFPVLANI